VLDERGAKRAETGVEKMGGHRGFLSRAEGCWTFDARDRMPRPSPATARHLAKNAPTATCSPPARAGSFHAPFQTPKYQIQGRALLVKYATRPALRREVEEASPTDR